MFNQFHWFFDNFHRIFNHLSLIFVHFYSILIVFAGFSIIFDGFFRRVTVQALPQGIAARVALTQLPRNERPVWMIQQWCVAPDCNYTRNLLRCSFCSAHLCGYHAKVVGRPQRGKNNQRMCGGSVRCSNPALCDQRVYDMRHLLDSQRI